MHFLYAMVNTEIKGKWIPVVSAPILRKQPAPLFKYEGSSGNGMPFKFDKTGRKRSTKSAYKWKEEWDKENKMFSSIYSQAIVNDSMSWIHVTRRKPNVFFNSKEGQGGLTVSRNTAWAFPSAMGMALILLPYIVLFILFHEPFKVGKTK